MTKLKPGDPVAYSVQFLKSIGQSHSDMAHDRGVVLSVQQYSENMAVATIKWAGESPEKVGVKALALVGLNTRFSNC